MNNEQPNISTDVINAFRYQYLAGNMSADTFKSFVPFMFNQAACDQIIAPTPQQ
ncbi:hypothetical protein [Apilactobacillus timberlakei]|uniref:hypothetical protein n=1 Tax=Apilactobacillus timberlakei TaxID=2008380 RepID=UPI0012FFDA1C|nr:hypothetical protein [Apilactobacillus timberlakei]